MVIGLCIHEVIQIAIVIQILHIPALYKGLLKFIGRAERALNHRTGDDVFALGTDKGRALAGLYMLKFHDLQNLSIQFKSSAISKIAC